MSVWACEGGSWLHDSGMEPWQCGGWGRGGVGEKGGVEPTASALARPDLHSSDRRSVSLLSLAMHPTAWLALAAALALPAPSRAIPPLTPGSSAATVELLTGE